MKKILDQILAGQDLSQSESYNVMNEIMSGKFNDIQIAGFLIALRSKGETVEEITGFAEAMRSNMIKVSLDCNAIDMCGTGGDSTGTFNISTAASFVAAGAGIHIAKHGNRSMTSKSGSADVLQALGVPIDKAIEESARDIEKIGLGFMFAPSYHPAMKYASGARVGLAIRTVFNILGPLCNPANVKAQAMGIFSPNYTEVQAKVLKTLGSSDVMIFYGRDGLDEITTTNTTKITQMQNYGEIKTVEFDASKLGLKRTSMIDLKGGNPSENAKIIKSILNGKNGPQRDIVLINAAAGIVVGGQAKNLNDGLLLAIESIDSGRALNILNQLVS